jgi:hypothetical protein
MANLKKTEFFNDPQFNIDLTWYIEKTMKYDFHQKYVLSCSTRTLWWSCLPKIYRGGTMNSLYCISCGYFLDTKASKLQSNLRLNFDWKRIRQKCYQIFKNEKFKKIFHLFTCILPNYVPHKITKEFWKISHFCNMTAGFFLLRCQNSLR